MQAVAFASAPAIFASGSGSVRPCRSAAPDSVSSDSGRPRRGARGAVRCEVASSSAAPSAAGPQAARWAQKTVVIPPQRRGCHLITNKIVNEIRNDLAEFKCGTAHLFLQHTSASLTINENYDSDVQVDTETFLSRIVPEGPSAPWRHTIEGPDDMPAHIKSSMFGCSLMIPITNGRLNMGTWQVPIPPVPVWYTPVQHCVGLDTGDLGLLACVAGSYACGEVVCDLVFGSVNIETMLLLDRL